MEHLNAFEVWMVKRNLLYVATEGLAAVVARLKANGYDKVALAVEREENEKTTL